MQLVDQVLAEGGHGGSRAAVIREAVLEHARHILAGGSPHDPASWQLIQVRKPSCGGRRFEQRLEPGEGRAVPVRRGEVLRMSQLVGGQCIDFNGYNLHDYKEWLDNGFNRQRGIVTGTGTLIWSGSPRGRPMYLILGASETCDQFYEGHRCNGIILEREFGFTHQPSCQDAFAEAIREYGLTPDDVHDSYNFWMPTAVDPQGRRIYGWNRAREGDYVELLALFDTLSVAVACPSHMNSVNNYHPQPVHIAVHEATPATLALVDEIQGRWGRFDSQQKPDGFRQPRIRDQRELRPDPAYRPQFTPMPEQLTVDVELTEPEETIMEGLRQTGYYGPSIQEAVRVAFLRWYEQNRLRSRYIKYAIRD